MSSLNLWIPKEAKEIIEKEAKFEGKSISDYIGILGIVRNMISK